MKMLCSGARLSSPDLKALHAARKACDLQEKFASRLSEVDLERLGERRKLVEAELKRIARLGTS
jgi:hypothetical protein